MKKRIVKKYHLKSNIKTIIYNIIAAIGFWFLMVLIALIETM